MKTVCITFVLGLMMFSWGCKQTQECASLSYSEVCRIVLGLKNMTETAPVYTNQMLQLAIKSELPGVRTEDIKVYIDARAGRIPIPLSSDGTFSFPVRNDLLKENPRIVANQPKGTMMLAAVLIMKRALPAEGFDGDRMRYNNLFFAQDLKPAMEKIDFGDDSVNHAISQGVGIVQIIPKKDVATASIVVESVKGRIIVPRDKDGVFRLRYDKQLAEENPWIFMPTNCNWEIKSAMQGPKPPSGGALESGGIPQILK